MLWLALLTSMALLAVATSAWFGLSLRGLMWVQTFVLTIIGIVAWRYLYKLYGHKLSRVGDEKQEGAEYFHKLVKFVPVGLAIGIMSPVSMLLVRGMLSNSLSWSDVGFLQALWRSTEWVTATAAGVLLLIFLPRFSATYGSAQFKTEMTRAGVMVLIPAACLLLLIFFNQRVILATLYNARFVVSDETAALFMLGCWMRIASCLFAEEMTLERTALLYFVSYLVYLGFNALALLYSSRKTFSGSAQT